MPAIICLDEQGHGAFLWAGMDMARCHWAMSGCSAIPLPGEAESAEIPSSWDMNKVHHNSRSGRKRNTVCMWIKI